MRANLSRSVVNVQRLTPRGRASRRRELRDGHNSRNRLPSRSVASELRQCKAVGRAPSGETRQVRALSVERRKVPRTPHALMTVLASLPTPQRRHSCLLAIASRACPKP